MANKSKSKQIGNQIFTGRQLIAQIFGVKTQHVSRVLSDPGHDKKGFSAELDHYEKFQRAYIKKRQIILGINQK